MSKKTITFLIINAIASILLLIAIATITYSWYTNISQSSSVDVQTNGIVLSYIIDTDSSTENTQTLNVERLVFFDTDNEFEGKYFTTMARVVQIDITNKSKKDVNITVANLTDYSDNISEKTPYATCLVTDENTYDSTSTTKSVAGYIADEELTTTFTQEEVAKDDTVTFYLYIYGVQPDDDASNDFLDETYSFDLTISAVLSGNNATITEVEDETTTLTTSE